MGGCAGGHAVDAGLLGLLGWLLWLARGLLGAACRLLRRHQLWFRIRRRRLLRRRVERWVLLLQTLGHEWECDPCDESLQPDGYWGKNPECKLHRPGRCRSAAHATRREVYSRAAQ